MFFYITSSTLPSLSAHFLLIVFLYEVALPCAFMLQTSDPIWGMDFGHSDLIPSHASNLGGGVASPRGKSFHSILSASS